MIVVSIISILAAIVTPSYIRARKNSQNARFVNDLRVNADAFHQYATEHGKWPADENRGVVPAGMENYFKDTLSWTSLTPITGQWDWDYKSVPGVVAGVSVDDPGVDLDQLQAIDALIDDGDLSTGAFRSSPRGYTLQME